MPAGHGFKIGTGSSQGRRGQFYVYGLCEGRCYYIDAGGNMCNSSEQEPDHDDAWFNEEKDAESALLLAERRGVLQG